MNVLCTNHFTPYKFCIKIFYTYFFYTEVGPHLLIYCRDNYYIKFKSSLSNR